MAGLALLHFAAGAGLAATGWLMPRRVAAARYTSLAALLLDLLPLGLGAVLLGFAAGRPLFAGIIILVLGAGFTLADSTMRQTLHEPVVFSEAVELPQVFTHPHLYLPFAGPRLVIGGAAASVAAAGALLIIEPPLWTPHPITASAAALLVAGLLWLVSREPLLGAAASLARRLTPSGEPFTDAATLGPFAMLIVHATIARAERAGRRQALAAPAIATEARQEGRGPIVVVQCESFFDARRLGPLVPRDMLAGYDACCADASLFGRLAVPGWGANTMRTEFAVLTGIPEAELGYDRFNPYYALARVPIASQVWRLRRAGYRTICLHPFDRRFFRRDVTLPALGFEEFLGSETLGGAQVPPYCPDADLGGHILRILDEAGPRTLVFAITMANHGPWLAEGPPLDPAVAALFDPADVPDGAGLLRYLDGLKRSDDMLQMLMAALAARDDDPLLAFYGDHLPSFSAAFRDLRLTDTASDYVVWPGVGRPERRDLAAHELGRRVVDAALDRSACVALRQPASLPR